MFRGAYRIKEDVLSETTAIPGSRIKKRDVAYKALIPLGEEELHVVKSNGCCRVRPKGGVIGEFFNRLDDSKYTPGDRRHKLMQTGLSYRQYEYLRNAGYSHGEIRGADNIKLRKRVWEEYASRYGKTNSSFNSPEGDVAQGIPEMEFVIEEEHVHEPQRRVKLDFYSVCIPQGCRNEIAASGVRGAEKEITEFIEDSDDPAEAEKCALRAFIALKNSRFFTAMGGDYAGGIERLMGYVADSVKKGVYLSNNDVYCEMKRIMHSIDGVRRKPEREERAEAVADKRPDLKNPCPEATKIPEKEAFEKKEERQEPGSEEDEWDRMRICDPFTDDMESEERYWTERLGRIITNNKDPWYDPESDTRKMLSTNGVKRETASMIAKRKREEMEEIRGYVRKLLGSAMEGFSEDAFGVVGLNGGLYGKDNIRDGEVRAAE